jgi:hypothetical protein
MPGVAVTTRRDALRVAADARQGGDRHRHRQDTRGEEDGRDSSARRAERRHNNNDGHSQQDVVLYPRARRHEAESVDTPRTRNARIQTVAISTRNRATQTAARSEAVNEIAVVTG